MVPAFAGTNGTGRARIELISQQYVRVMAEIHFTSWLRELVPDGPVRVDGTTVGEALTALFDKKPNVRGYVLDDRGALRKHVCVFADGMRLPNGVAFNHPINPQSMLYVMQALSGG